jgi:excisionase family DNA binding protein
MSINLTNMLITESEAATLLRISLTSLRRWRREGRAPVYRKLGRSVRYRRDDLEDFIASSRCTETGWRSRQVAA